MKMPHVGLLTEFGNVLHTLMRASVTFSTANPITSPSWRWRDAHRWVDPLRGTIAVPGTVPPGVSMPEHPVSIFGRSRRIVRGAVAVAAVGAVAASAIILVAGPAVAAATLGASAAER